jgi:thermostable 8-oxoguanine DNA glycosylase
MNIGDLVQNEWGELGIILRQVGVVDRWIVRWLNAPSHYEQIRAQWGRDLYLLDSSETEKKVNKNT